MCMNFVLKMHTFSLCSPHPSRLFLFENATGNLTHPPSPSNGIHTLGFTLSLLFAPFHDYGNPSTANF